MLTRSTSDSNLNFDPEIDLTLRALRRKQRQRRMNQFNRMAQPERRILVDIANDKGEIFKVNGHCLKPYFIGDAINPNHSISLSTPQRI